jgi:DNA polymerase
MLGTDTTLKALRQTRFHDFHGIPLMVTYHPAALLRNQNFKRPTWDDVRELRERYDELVTKSSERPN